jgi:NADH-ubiquinone oxidoreductase chain 2
MLIHSLIFLLLSNAITSRRDKSILYSRVSISILLISALISYDNLSLLFLAKGIGIFGGLFHVTATTNTFHIFIFLITSVILLFSSLLSLIIGTVVGLTQSRIKRLFAFGTISHVGFILLGLTIHTVESTQAFMFYLIQYSISNLNAFILIITIGYSLYCYVYNGDSIDDKDLEDGEDLDKRKEISEKKENLQDLNNPPIQLIDQLKGYYYINPFLSLSLAITLFSFAGILPLIEFFRKQMILSAAIDNGYIFMSLVAILTSVVSAVYYLTIIKQIFFDKNDYSLNEQLEDLDVEALVTKENNIVEKVNIKIDNIVISSSLSLSISVITLIITLFIFIPKEILSLANILALLLFNL